MDRTLPLPETQEERNKGEMQSEGALAKGPRKRITEQGPYLEHGPVLEHMLLITHHTVLIQCWNPLLCILHDLEREDILVFWKYRHIWGKFRDSFPATLHPPSPGPKIESLLESCS